MVAGRELQFLEVVGTYVLANEVHFSNLTAKGVGNRHNVRYVLSMLWGGGGITDFNSSEHPL